MRVLNSFVYGGPNRRSDLTVVDQLVEFEPPGTALLAERAEAVGRGLLPALRGLAPEGTGTPSAPRPSGKRPAQVLGRLYADTAVWLQRLAGHPVQASGSEPAGEDDRCHAWFEYEDPETGSRAAELAQQLFDELLRAGAGPGNLAAWRDRARAFVAEARPRAMPADARAIFDAARRRGVPCFRMDRPPYAPVRGEFRVRPNALFRLGHGHRQHTVDGTFCVDRSEPVHALIRDRRQLYRRLESLGVPLPSGRLASRWCLTPERAARVAEQRGFPVAVRTDGRGGAAHPAPTPLHDPEAVRAAAAAALESADAVLVEPFVPGRTFHLLVAGTNLVDVLGDAASRVRDRRDPAATNVHPEVRSLCEGIATELGVGLAVVTMVAPDLQAAPASTGGAVVDVDVAPRLDRFYELSDLKLATAAQRFVDWLFPRPAEDRVPVVAVTGTNGKTTTCRLVYSIFQRAGYRAGLACSDGCYVDGRRVSQLEDGYLPGHLTVLDNPHVEAAVLESTRGGAASVGLGFDWCDAAACLNVTPDHLNDVVGIRTLEQMAALKCWIVQRARRAVVLNADDPRCLAMTSRLRGRRIGLTSQREPGTELLERAGAAGCACVAEFAGGDEWIVLYDAQGRSEVTPVASMPIAFRGRARHNVSNALHAAALGYFMGVSIDQVASGLQGLEPVFEALPGRLTFRRDLPFDVVMDYAHNPDGIKHLCDFAQRTPVRGRRIVALSCDAHNSDDFIRDTAGAAAGHFEHYVCKNFGDLAGRAPEEIPRLLREGLMARGVAAEAITCIAEEFEAVDAALAMARAGDLVVILAGKRKQAIWDLIASFGADVTGQDADSNKVGQRSPSS